MLPRLFRFHKYYILQKLYFRFLLLLLCFVFLAGCEKKIDLSSIEPYAQAIEKSFVLQQDYYIFRFDDSNNLLIGRINEFPTDVSSKYIGQKFDHATIIGCVVKGQSFVIKKIVREETIEDFYENYYVTFAPESILIDVSLLSEVFHNPPFTKTWSDPPIFDPKAALPLPSDGIWWK